jgi:hypothetical protein
MTINTLISFLGKGKADPQTAAVLISNSMVAGVEGKDCWIG